MRGAVTTPKSPRDCRTAGLPLTTKTRSRVGVSHEVAGARKYFRARGQTFPGLARSRGRIPAASPWGDAPHRLRANSRSMVRNLQVAI
jgi:hypothetical protein